MIPAYNSSLTNVMGTRTPLSKAHKMDIDGDVINGHCCELDAMKQIIYKILNTERYNHVIYSWNYGIELQDLFGKPMDYVGLELKRRISEALLQDNRIISVTDFEFDVSTRRTVKVMFTVNTIYGDVKSERMVNV